METGAIKDAINMHRAGPFVWRRRDCVTLVEMVLAAQGIDVNFRAEEPDIDASAHDEAKRLAVAKHGTLAAMMAARLDAVRGLERVESRFDWAPGMVGITPEEGPLILGTRVVDPAVWGVAAGVVGADPVRPWVMSLDRGLQPVNRLWPRWKRGLLLTGGR